MNHEDAKNAKEEKEVDAVLPSRLCSLIIPIMFLSCTHKNDRPKLTLTYTLHDS